MVEIQARNGSVGTVQALKEKYETVILEPVLTFCETIRLTANRITWLRIALLFPLYLLYAQEWYIGSGLVYVLGLWCDHLDGAYARNKNDVSALGKVLDPTADKVYHGSIIVYLFLYENQTIAFLLGYLVILFVIELYSCFLAWMKYILDFGKNEENNHRMYNEGANRFGKYKMTLQGIGFSITMFSPPESHMCRIGISIACASLPLAALSVITHTRNFMRKPSSTK